MGKSLDSYISLAVFLDEQSQFFHRDSGVRQGENLSPVLFAIFLNNLEDYLVQHNCNDITLDSDNQDN